MEKSGRHLRGRVQFCDLHRCECLVSCSITELTVLIAPPTANGSIGYTCAGKVQSHGSLSSRIDVGHEHRSPIILSDLAIPQPTITIVPPTTDGAIAENSTGMASSCCNGQYSRRFCAMGIREKDQHGEPCEDRRTRDLLNPLRHSIPFSVSSKPHNPIRPAYSRLPTRL